MGTLAYSDIKAEVLLALGNPTDVSDAQVARTLNIAQTRISRISRWEELETLFTNTFSLSPDPYGDKIITLPANIRDIYSFRVYNETRTQKLTRESARKLDSDEPANEYLTRQMPTKYARWAEFLEVNYPPDEAYFARIRAVKWPAAFVGETQNSQVSDLDQKDDMLISLCVNWIYQSRGNYERAGRWWTTFRNMLESAMHEEAEKPDQDRLPPSSGMTIDDYWTNPFVKENP